RHPALRRGDRLLGRRPGRAGAAGGRRTAGRHAACRHADDLHAPGRPAAAARIPVTPLARRLAAHRGIDLSTVTGSGPRGRIRARDLEGVAAASAKPDPQAPRQTAQVGALPPAACDPRPGTLSAPASRERVIAEKLTASKQQIPHFYLSVEAEM